MFVIRAYNQNDDELIAEYDLPGIDAEVLERILGFVPTPYGSTPLERRDMIALGGTFNLTLEKGAAYFLDFDADRVPAQPRRGRRAAAAL
jgi:hypothetical protein